MNDETALNEEFNFVKNELIKKLNNKNIVEFKTDYKNKIELSNSKIEIKIKINAIKNYTK